MSKYLRVQNTSGDKKEAITLQGNVILNVPLKSVEQNQYGTGTSFSPININPGSNTSATITFNDRDILQEDDHFIVYSVVNGSAGQDITFYRGALTHFDQIEITINDSPDKLLFNSYDQLVAIYDDYIKSMGKDAEELLSFFRNEINTYNGITSDDATTAPVFYFWITPLISFQKTVTRSVLRTMKIDLRATPEPSSAQYAVNICKSSANTAGYTKANITFQNIRFQRFTSILNDKRLLVSPLVGNVPVRHIHWRTDVKELKTTTWNAGDTLTFKLSDVVKRKNIQNIQIYARVRASTYNSSEAQKEYSGYKYFTYKIRNLADDRVLDLTDQRLCMKHEIEQYKNTYGWDSNLPLAVWHDTSNGLSRYYLRLTNITFDNVAQEPNHELVYSTNSSVEDYEITLNAPTGVALAGHDVIAVVVYAETFEIGKDASFKKLNY